MGSREGAIEPSKARHSLRRGGVSAGRRECESMRDEFADEERWITIGMDSLARILVVIYTWRSERLRQFQHGSPPRGRGGNTRSVMKNEYDFGKGKRGAVLRVPSEKTRVTIRLDKDILDWFRQ